MGGTVSSVDCCGQHEESCGETETHTIATVGRREKSWSAALTLSRHHNGLDDLLISERRYVDSMQVRLFEMQLKKPAHVLLVTAVFLVRPISCAVLLFTVPNCLVFARPS